MKTLLAALIILCLMGCQSTPSPGLRTDPSDDLAVTYKIVPGGGVGGQVVVEIQEDWEPPYRIDKYNLAKSIENIKQNRKHYRTEEAYQRALAIKQGAWDALMKWEAEQDG